MPRKDDINKKYHSRNERAQGGYSPSGTDVVLHNPVTDWWDDNFLSLENAWNGKMDSERDFYFQSALQTVPGISGLFQANWNKDALQKYMTKYGMSWSDLLSRNVFGGQFSNSSALRSSVNFLGDMVKELYS